MLAKVREEMLKTIHGRERRDRRENQNAFLCGLCALGGGECFELPDVTGVVTNHGLSGFASPGLLEFRHVLDHSIHPPMPRRVWVRGHHHAFELRTPLFAPYPPESQEEALFRSVAVNFRGFLPGFIVSDHVFESHQRDASAAVVGSILAQSKAAVELQIVHGNETAVFVSYATDALFEF